MADWTQPITWTTGQKVYADTMNEQIRDNMLHLYETLGGMLKVARVSVTDRTTGNMGTYDFTTHAKGGMDTIGLTLTGTEFTVPAGAYIFALTGWVYNAAGAGEIQLYNITAAQTSMGTGTLLPPTLATARSGLTVFGLLSIGDTDYKLRTAQYSSGTMGSGGHLLIVRVGEAV
jgi:hypothetical protein